LYFGYGQTQRLAFPLFQFTETRNKIVTVALTPLIHINYISGENTQRVKIKKERYYLSWKRDLRNLAGQLAKNTE